MANLLTLIAYLVIIYLLMKITVWIAATWIKISVVLFEIALILSILNMLF